MGPGSAIMIMMALRYKHELGGGEPGPRPRAAAKLPRKRHMHEGPRTIAIASGQIGAAMK